MAFALFSCGVNEDLEKSYFMQSQVNQCFENLSDSDQIKVDLKSLQTVIRNKVISLEDLDKRNKSFNRIGAVELDGDNNGSTPYKKRILNDEYFNKKLKSLERDYNYLLKWIDQIDNKNTRLINASIHRFKYLLSKLMVLNSLRDRWMSRKCISLYDDKFNQSVDLLGYIDKNDFLSTKSKENYLKETLPPQIYKKFYGILNKKDKFKCISTNKKTILYVNFKSKSKEIQTLVNESLAQYWKSKKFMVKARWNDRKSSKVINISFTKEKVSKHLMLTDHYIYLSKSDMNDKNIALKVLAHEIGHVFGFKDCYVEFFDCPLQELIYYEIDNQDLMCSLAGNVLEKHFIKLKKFKCDEK